MAAASDLDSLVNRSLDVLAGVVTEDLDWAVSEWATLSELERVDVLLEWDHLMADYFRRLDDYARVGLLTDDQCERYRALLALFRERMPLIEKLDLYRPPVELPP